MSFLVDHKGVLSFFRFAIASLLMLQKQFEGYVDMGVLVLAVKHRLPSAVFAPRDVKHMLAVVEHFVVGVKGTDEHWVVHLKW